MSKKYTESEADDLVQKWSTRVVSGVIVFIPLCLVVAVIGVLLSLIGGK